MNYSQNDVKQINRTNVLSLIAEKGSISRRDICTILGSSMTTVLKITDYLEERGWITVSGEVNTSRGRKPQLLTFQPDKIRSLAIDYDGNRALVAVCNYYGNELFFKEYSVSNDVVIFFQDNLPKIFKETLKEGNTTKDELVGIGLCLPGAFSLDGSYSNIGPISKFQKRTEFSKEFKKFSSEIGIPMYCYNDVNACVCGEFSKRSDYGIKDLAFFYAGKGLGAGIIMDSKLRLGPHAMAGEVGYISYEPEHVSSPKQPGWLESNLSKENLRERFPELKDGTISSDLVDYTAKYIALTIANISNLLDIEQFVLDGDLIRRLEEFGLKERIDYYTARYCLLDVLVDKPICAHPSLTGLGELVISKGLYDLVKSE